LLTAAAAAAAAAVVCLSGNALFSKGRYLPAAERYTEAITLIPKDPGFVTLYVNRAMCYKKVERWQAVVEDAATALSLDSSSMKAHYLLGIGLREQQQLSQGISHLQKALEAAREKGDSIKDEM
jgi:STIP1 family protein 1